MANTHTTLVSLFDDVAEAIREKDGTTADIVADTFPDRIRAISSREGSVLNGTREWKQSNVTEGYAWAEYFSCLAHAGNIWLCATSKGIFKSEAGMVWEKSLSGSGYNVCYGNGVWLATVGSSGPEGTGVYYSSDAVTWTRSLANVYFRELIYANGYFVGVGSKGIHRSVDGVTWEQVNTESTWRRVAYKDGTWVIAKANTSGTVHGLYYSKDNCSTISPCTIPSYAESGGGNVENGYRFVAAGENGWVAAGGFGTYGSPILYSANGISWNLSNVLKGRNIVTGFYADGKWVLGNPGDKAPYYSLDDGKTWAEGVRASADKTASSNLSFYNVVHEEIWMAACSPGVLSESSENGFLYSADGIHWYECTCDSCFTDIRYANGVWVGVSSGSNGIFYSEDFVPVE